MFTYPTKVPILNGTHSNVFLLGIRVINVTTKIINCQKFWLLDLGMVPCLKSGSIQGTTDNLLQDNICPINSLFHWIKGYSNSLPQVVIAVTGY